MKYTVKQLAEYSGVSTRTLRYYDKIGLLSPACYASNGYRYYSDKELLLLQQILFFKELGLQLSKIKSIITSSEFDQIESLAEHKSQLINKVNTYKNLINTVDKTMKHIQGKLKMSEHELYIGFKHPDQIEMAEYLHLTIGDVGDKIIAQAKEKMKLFSPEDFKLFEKEKNQWVANIKKAINNKEKPRSKKVQELIKVFYKNRIQRFCSITPEELMMLIKAESEHPKYQKKFDKIHPDFTDFFLDATQYFIDNNLNERVTDEQRSLKT